MGNYFYGSNVEMSEKSLDLSFEDLGLGTKMFPRCVEHSFSKDVSDAYISVFENGEVEQSMKRRSDKEATFYYVFLQQTDCAIEIKTGSSVSTISYPLDKTQFLKEFDTEEKMIALTELLKELVPVEEELVNIMADVRPEEQLDIGTKVVLENDVLFTEEEKYVQDRLLKNKDFLPKWMEKILGVSSVKMNKQPRIAICTSGGGFRAAIAAREFTKLIEAENLLPSVTHYSSLSGSTWFMCDWLRNGKVFPEEQRDLFEKKVSNRDYIGGLLRIWMKYNLPNQEITDCLVLENWTNILGYAYFGKDWYSERVKYRFSDLKLNSQNNPWPIMSAIGKPKKNTDGIWDYYEFTPQYITKIGSNYSIKTMSFGNKIEIDGIKKVQDKCSDELAQLMAIWGSAMCAEKHLASVVIGAMCGSFGRNVFDQVYRNYTEKECIIIPFEAPNWDPTSLEEHDILQFRDAGFLNNIPLPPLLQKKRNIDVIIVLDASEDEYENPFTNMYWTQEWAKNNNIPFHEILTPKDDIKKWRDPQIFESPNGSPIILYLPVGLYPQVPTFGLRYTDDQRTSIIKEVNRVWKNSKESFAAVLNQKFCTSV